MSNIVAKEEPQVLGVKVLGAAACVPIDWTTEQCEAFINHEAPSGTSTGWHFREDGHKDLMGDSAKVACHERVGYMHVTFEC